MRTALKLLKWTLYNLCAVLLILYAIHWWHVRHLGSEGKQDLDELSRWSGLPIEVVHSIGSFRVDHQRRDFRTLPFRRPGSVRVGLFGDSFTFCDEVGARMTFAHFLDERFRKDGFTNVETINFGSSWQGFGQATRMREQFGNQFDLSFAVVGPGALFADRDLRFNHSFDQHPYYIHGRFVLEGDGLRWIDPLGSYDADARFAIYNRFIPPWTYLRYDRDPPAMMRALMRSGSQANNPFYYSKLDAEREAERIYDALIKRWSEGPAQFVLLQVQESLARLARPHHAKMVATALQQEVHNFYMRRLYGHLSAAGNRLVAGVLHDILSAQPIGWETPELTFSRAPAPGRPLTDFSHAEVRFGGSYAGTFEYGVEQGNGGELDKPTDFHADRIPSLLLLSDPRTPMMAAMTLPQPLKPDSKVELRLDCKGGSRRVPVGTVSLLDDAGSFGVVISPGFDLYLGKGSLMMLLQRLGAKPMLVPGEVFGGELQVDGTPILRLINSHVNYWDLEPINGSRRLVIRPGADDDFDVEKLPASGTVTIELAGERPWSLPIGTWTKRKSEITWNDDGLHQWIKRSAANPKIAEVGRR